MNTLGAPALDLELVESFGENLCFGFEHLTADVAFKLDSVFGAFHHGRLAPTKATMPAMAIVVAMKSARPTKTQ